MKVFVVLALCMAAASADLICVIGELACKINCLASGHLDGACHEETGDCECDKKTDAKPRTELLCMLGGNLACEINCFTTVGHFEGYCDEKNDCHCGPKPTESRNKRSVPKQGDLACRHGGDDVCSAFCHWTTGKQEGFCDEEDNCHCAPKPEARSDLACRHGGDDVCAAFCHWTTGKQEGFCDEENNCHCAPKPEAKSELICVLGGNLACEINCLTTVGHFLGHCDEKNDCHCTAKPTESRNKRSVPKQGDLACRHGGDDVCSAFCHWTTGKQEGFCDEEDNCHCAPKPQARSDLACRHGGDDVCAAFCHWTTGKQEGFCDEEDNCHCKPKSS